MQALLTTSMTFRAISDHSGFALVGTAFFIRTLGLLTFLWQNVPGQVSAKYLSSPSYKPSEQGSSFGLLVLSGRNYRPRRRPIGWPNLRFIDHGDDSILQFIRKSNSSVFYHLAYEKLTKLHWPTGSPQPSSHSEACYDHLYKLFASIGYSTKYMSHV